MSDSLKFPGGGGTRHFATCFVILNADQLLLANKQVEQVVVLMKANVWTDDKAKLLKLPGYVY